MTEQTIYERLGGVNATAMGFGGGSSRPRPSSVTRFDRPASADRWPRAQGFRPNVGR